MFARDTHILVVDDSLNIRRMVVDTLQRLGFSKITTAEDVPEAKSKLDFFAKSENPIGLILSDLNMPGPSGLDFLRQVREKPEMKNLPFLLVTTESEKGAVIEAAANGVSSYVVKPFTSEILGKRIGEAWHKHNKA